MLGKHWIVIASMFFGVFFASCTTNRGFVSAVKRTEIQQVQQFEPFVFVGIVKEGDKIAYSDSLTEVAQ